LIQKATFRNSGNSLVYFGLTTNDEMKLYYVQYTLGDLINPTGIETNSSSAFSIYPNPTENSFTIQFDLESESNIEINLFDISGRKVMQKNFNKLSSGIQNITIDSELSDGIYWVNVLSNKGTSTHKICIQH
jgi:hypothetical protein